MSENPSLSGLIPMKTKNQEATPGQVGCIDRTPVLRTQEEVIAYALILAVALGHPVHVFRAARGTNGWAMGYRFIVCPPSEVHYYDWRGLCREPVGVVHADGRIALAWGGR